MTTVQYLFNLVQDDINIKTPQELMLSPALLDFCNRWRLEKEWK